MYGKQVTDKTMLVAVYSIVCNKLVITSPISGERPIVIVIWVIIVQKCTTQLEKMHFFYEKMRDTHKKYKKSQI